MKIGVIAPVAHPLPPRRDRPWEQIAWHLTEGFVARGHQVSLFATADSSTSARLIPTVAAGYARDQAIEPELSRAVHVATVLEHAGEFDVIANLCDVRPVLYSRLIHTPMLTTIHSYCTPEVHRAYRAYQARNRDANYLSISQASRLDGLRYLATVPHGIDVQALRYAPDPADYLLALGPIGPDAGIDQAIAIARQTGSRLIIAGDIVDDRYFHSAIATHLSGTDICYLGTAGPAERAVLLAGARALVQLCQFGDPFGRSVMEALAAGTPVISAPLGVLPELIEHGKTGFLVPGVPAAIAAVGQLDTLSRAHCRAEAVRRFSLDRTVDDYLELFDRVLGHHHRALHLAPSRQPAPVSRLRAVAGKFSAAEGHLTTSLSRHRLGQC